MIAAKGARLDTGFLIPLGVFAMLVAGWYIQTRAAIAEREALSRERVAAIERGVPVPEPKPEPPQPPQLAGHPLKSTLATLAVGVALLVGLPPNLRVWGMVVTAIGLAGLCHWLLAGRNEWRRQQVMEEEAHRAYVEYLKALAMSTAPGDGARV
jgi:hypothetical protein